MGWSAYSGAAGGREAQTFDAAALAEKPLRYEKLNQLAFELLLGLR